MAKLSESAESELKTFETVSTDRATAMALAAAQQAWLHAGLDATSLTSAAPERRGVYWGTGMGGLDTTESTYHRTLLDKAQLRPMTVVRIMASAAAAQIALKFGLQGANHTYSVACASSAIAIGEALWAIRSGRLDVAVVGGAEAMLAPVVMAAWGALRVMAVHGKTPNPELPCRPFSLDRSGLVIGEGAAAFILESEAHAKARGAVPLAELAGYASNCDATSLVQPDQSGQVRAMRLALKDAGLVASNIGSVNAHATGTDAGDVIEAAALAAVFCQAYAASQCPPIAATKAMHGHLLGAAGAVEAAMSIAALQTQTTPGVLGLEPMDPRCTVIDCAAGPRQARINAVLSNSFAFGGSNASLIFKQA
jgi:3-oxoacyl-[acyl-carrier-protein] synthase II